MFYKRKCYTTAFIIFYNNNNNNNDYTNLLKLLNTTFTRNELINGWMNGCIN